MISKKELRKQVAEVIGCDESELIGENIADTLNSVDTDNVTVFWACVKFDQNETF